MKSLKSLSLSYSSIQIRISFSCSTRISGALIISNLLPSVLERTNRKTSQDLSKPSLRSPGKDISFWQALKLVSFNKGEKNEETKNSKMIVGKIKGNDKDGRG